MSNNCNKYSYLLTDRRILVEPGESVIHANNQVKVGTLPPRGLTDEVLVKCSDRDYHVRWDSITNIIGTITTPNVIIQNIAFVTQNGDDVTGVVGDLTRTFSTLEGANQALDAIGVGLRMVYLWNTSLVETINGTRRLGAGYPIVLENSSLFIIDNTGNGLNSTGNDLIIRGNGQLVYESNFNGPTTLSPNLTIDVNQFFIDGNNPQSIFESINGNVNIKCNFISVGNAAGFIKIANSELNLDVDQFSFVSAPSNYFYIKSNVNKTCTININDLRIQSLSQYTSVFRFHDNNGHSNITLDKVTITSNANSVGSLIGIENDRFNNKTITINNLVTDTMILNRYDVINLSAFVDDSDDNSFAGHSTLTINNCYLKTRSTLPLFFNNGYFDLRGYDRWNININVFSEWTNNMERTCIIDISSGTYCQISGSIIGYASTTPIADVGIIQYGLSDYTTYGAPFSSTISNSGALVKNMTINVHPVTTNAGNNFSILRTSALANSDVSLINVYTNTIADPSVTYDIDTLIVNTKIR